MSRIRGLVSWLDEMVEQAPQAKASAEQWLATLRKNPKVNNEEIVDRGLDQWLQGPDSPSGSVTREEVLGYLNDDYPAESLQAPVSPGSGEYSDYATPGLDSYDERVRADYDWDPWSKSSHFPEFGGYQYHTRGGYLEEPELGAGRIMDEVQADTMRRAEGVFDPNNRANRMREMEEPEVVMDRLAQNSNFSNSELARMTYTPGGDYAQNFDDAQYAIEDAMESATPGGDTYRYLEELADHNDATQAATGKLNLPGKKSWPWQGTADNLVEAIAEDQDFMAWPAADTQYRRYYQRTPEGYARVDDREMAKSAKNSLAMYNRLYDRDLPRNKRWKQLGLKPKLRKIRSPETITEATGFDGSPVRQVDGGRSLGDYWVVELTPETRERLRKSGIPYYVSGGMAVLGQQMSDDDTFTPDS